MAEPAATSTSAPSSQPTAIDGPDTVTTTAGNKPRCWGWFEFEEDGKKGVIEFVKEGNDGEQGVGGYVFGRRQECDYV